MSATDTVQVIDVRAAWADPNTDYPTMARIIAAAIRASDWYRNSQYALELTESVDALAGISDAGDFWPAWAQVESLADEDGVEFKQ